MGTTPTYQLPYPEATDPADVPLDMRELAERIEAVLAGFAIPATRKLAEYVLAAPGASFDFQGIAQTYATLMLVGHVSAPAACEIGCYVNGVTSNGYEWNNVNAVGSAAPANTPGATAVGRWRLGLCGGSGSEFVAFTAMIPDYTSTRRKHYHSQAGGHFASGLYSEIGGGRWHNAGAGTPAINRVTIFPVGQANFDAGSRVTLYGLT